MGTPISADELGPSPGPPPTAREGLLNWEYLLKPLVWVFPVPTWFLVNFTLICLPALRQKVLSDGLSLSFALPFLSGLQITFLGGLWIVVVFARSWWWQENKLVVFWLRFLAGWFLSAVATNGLLTYRPSATDISTFTVQFTFQQYWYFGMLPVLACLCPWVFPPVLKSRQGAIYLDENKLS